MKARLAVFVLLIVPALASAQAPVASYIFPAGGQRGTKVQVRVGGLFLHEECGFDMIGPGIAAPATLKSTKTTWFEGPLLPLPDSQRQEDYPKDMAGTVAIAQDAPLGTRLWRLWTSQGATPSMKFVVGDLPEIVETEIDGDPIAVPVTLPVTINGRIFPREDIDVYSFRARKNEAFRCEVHAARLGSPLDARLEVRDAQGRRIAEADAPVGGDAVLRFTAPADGDYHVRIQDALNLGGQAYVYRLTVTPEPFVDRVFPLGGRRGTTVALNLTGAGVPRQAAVAIPQGAPSDFLHAFTVRGKQTNLISLDVDDLPEIVGPKSEVVAFPAVLNGAITVPGQVDSWGWQGKKGDAWDFELRAARLGSRLDGVVTICDSEGKTLTKAEATAADCIARFNVPADGAYVVKVQDRFASRGGPDFAYRLRVAGPPSAEDFRLTMNADALTLPRKGLAKLKLTAERIGKFSETINLDVQGLPKGVSFSPTTIQSYGTAVDITFKADEKTPIVAGKLTIVGRTKALERTAKMPAVRGLPEQSSLLLAVSLPTPFVIKGEYDMGFAPRGGIHKRKYTIERNGYEGRLEISLADRQARHLQGVEGPTIEVPAGVSEFTYAAYLPPWMETGRTCRVCVQGVGFITDFDGTQHRVCFSSVNQNEQLVAVVGPGKLAMEADRTSFRAEPGKSFTVAVKVQRGQGVTGDVELDLIAPPHLRGLTAPKATIAAKDDRGQLTVACNEQLCGPFNMPIILRATLRQNGEPIVAEGRLDVQP
jgi:hypothetical protein